RDAASRGRAGRGADPARGRDRGGGRERQDVLRLGRPRVRQRHPRGGATRGARECGYQMSSVEQLDELITRLERAAEQLRSGELSSDAAAGMVEDCAAVATQAASELEQLAQMEAS